MLPPPRGILKKQGAGYRWLDNLETGIVILRIVVATTTQGRVDLATGLPIWAVVYHPGTRRSFLAIGDTPARGHLEEM